MIANRCKSCIWWDSQHQSTKLLPLIPEKTAPGFCRKHKPGSIVIEKHYFGVQPVMDADEFCGEYREDK